MPCSKILAGKNKPNDIQEWKTLHFEKRSTLAESPCKSIFQNQKGQTDPYARPRRYFRTKKHKIRKNTYGSRFFCAKNSINAKNAEQKNFSRKKKPKDIAEWKALLFEKRSTLAESLCKSIFQNQKGQTDPYARPRRYFRTKKHQRRKNTDRKSVV